MVRTIVVPGLVLAAIGALVFGPQWLETAGTAEERTECDLLSRACTWETDEGAWRVELSTLEEGDQGMEYRLAITVPEAPDRFLAVLRGQSMYMGEYPVPMERQEPLSYQATFTAPFCTTGAEMIWRIDLQDGQKVLENVPWALVFRAEK